MHNPLAPLEAAAMLPRRGGRILLTAIGLIILIGPMVLLSGCTAIITPYGSVYRFATDSAVESATIETPEGVKVQIGGYNSTAKVDAVIELLQAVR